MNDLQTTPQYPLLNKQRLEEYRLAFKLAERTVEDLPKEARVVDIQKRLNKPDEWVLLGREMRLGLDNAYFTSILVVSKEFSDPADTWMMWGHYGMSLFQAVQDLGNRIYR